VAFKKTEDIKKYRREYMRRYRSIPENKERIRQQACLLNRKRLATFSGRIVQIRARSKRKNLEFNLTEEYLESIYPTEGMCPLLNIALDWDSPPYHDNTPSLDRIDNSKGYIKGNVHWVSWRANRLMSNMQPDEIFMLAQNYKKIYDEAILS